VALLAPAWVLVVVCLGLLLAFLCQELTSLLAASIPTRLDCRGPPAIV
jgi:hypothetical protein